MRSYIRDAVVRIVRRRKITPNDTGAWNKITIRDVIKEADISIGTFYKYFKDRADLAQTLWTEPVDKLRSEMQAEFDQADGPEKQIRILLEQYARFATENPQLFKHIFLTIPDGRYRPEEKIELKDEMFHRNLCAAFKEGQQSGVFGDFDVGQMAQIFWAAIHGSLALPINLDRVGFDSPGQLPSHMIEKLMAMILNNSNL